MRTKALYFYSAVRERFKKRFCLEIKVFTLKTCHNKEHKQNRKNASRKFILLSLSVFDAFPTLDLEGRHCRKTEFYIFYGQLLELKSQKVLLNQGRSFH